MWLRCRFVAATCCWVIGVAGVQSCNASPQHTFYAETSAAKAAQFPSDLARLLSSQGVLTSSGKATDNRGKTLFVIEAKHGAVRLWAQNMPLGPSNPACGNEEIDSRQYIVTVSPRFILLPDTEATQLASTLSRDLTKLGYQIRQSPLDCGLIADIR
jgi:hypothetical protein